MNSRTRDNWRRTKTLGKTESYKLATGRVLGYVSAVMYPHVPPSRLMILRVLSKSTLQCVKQQADRTNCFVTGLNAPSAAHFRSCLSFASARNQSSLV